MSICEYCKCEFDGGARFCSQLCNSREANRQLRIKNAEYRRTHPRECRGCGEQFTPTTTLQQTFCCRACWYEYTKGKRRQETALKRPTLPEKECEHCGSKFIQHDVQKRFCCGTCKYTYHKDKALAKREAGRQAGKTCKLCGKHFVPQRTLKAEYCSHRCRTALRKKMDKAFRRCLEMTGTTKEGHTYDILGYTPRELRERITSHPNWDKVKDGDWELDHIFPYKAFIDHGIQDIRLICCLDNLQPLSRADNNKKAARYRKDQFMAFLAAHTTT